MIHRGTNFRTVAAVLLSVMLLVTGATPAFAGETASPGENTEVSSAIESENAGAAFAKGVRQTEDAAQTEGSSAIDGENAEAPAAIEGEDAEAPAAIEGGGTTDETPAVEEPALEDDGAATKGSAITLSWTPDDGLPTVTGVKLNIPNNDQLIVSWNGSEIFDGYQISYARNVLFLRDKTITVEDPETNNVTLDGLDTTKRYYVRVRGYKEYLGDQLWSDWVSKKTSKSTAAASVKFVKTNGQKVDIRKQAGSKLSGYTISQGACSDGKHVYMCFERRNGDDNGSGRARIKIAKVKIANWKLLKVSGPMKLGHANDITYNGNQNILVVTGAKTNDPYVRIVNASTLKKTGQKKIVLDSRYSYVKAFNAIDYDSESHTYYIRSRKYGGLSFTLDENFRMMDVSTVSSVFPSRFVQSCVAIGENFILTQAWYQSSSKNTITIFEKTGKKLQHIKLKLTGELESVFMIGDELYATVHKHVSGGYMTGYIFKILL